MIQQRPCPRTICPVRNRNPDAMQGEARGLGRRTGRAGFLPARTHTGARSSPRRPAAGPAACRPSAQHELSVRNPRQAAGSGVPGGRHTCAVLHAVPESWDGDPGRAPLTSPAVPAGVLRASSSVSFCRAARESPTRPPGVRKSAAHGGPGPPRPAVCWHPLGQHRGRRQMPAGCEHGEICAPDLKPHFLLPT